LLLAGLRSKLSALHASVVKSSEKRQPAPGLHYRLSRFAPWRELKARDRVAPGKSALGLRPRLRLAHFFPSSRILLQFPVGNGYHNLLGLKPTSFHFHGDEAES